MNSKHRIASILQATTLDAEITGFETFHLSALHLKTVLDFELPTKLRLGHLVEKMVAELIKSSSNYKVLYENIQIKDGKNTIGELDFIIQHISTKQVIHLELAYKFYLYDPTISSETINNWIGPNRNDSLREKLDKLKNKQFPLLFHDCAKSALNSIEIDKISQALCMLTSLFVPYTYNGNFSPSYKKAIKGYYLNFETFQNLDHSAKTYHIPFKTAWGMNPAEHEVWTDFETITQAISKNMQEKRSLLCWQKYNDEYDEFFIVWW